MKATIKSWLKRGRQRRQDRQVSQAELENVRRFLERFRAHYIGVDLIRVGGDGDGGYLLPDCLADLRYCFSPGVAYQADFEKELSDKYGIRSFMADASVDEPPIADENFHFIQKFLGAHTDGAFITLGDWVAQSIEVNDGGRLLQMDIEGGEYDVLTFESAEFLSQFSVMVIEFHEVNRIFDRHYRQMLSAIFEKLYRHFVICHVHPNNCCGIESHQDIDVPRVMEVSFVRRDVAEKLERTGPVVLPHALDDKNVARNADITMPEIWWKKV